MKDFGRRHEVNFNMKRIYVSNAATDSRLRTDVDGPSQNYCILPVDKRGTSNAWQQLYAKETTYDTGQNSTCLYDLIE